MKLRELLVSLIPSKEIKSRLANGQIKINNISVKENIELNVQDGYWELGDFIFYNSKSIGIHPILGDIKDFFGTDTDEPTNIHDLDFLSAFTLISISKREHFVFITI